MTKQKVINIFAGPGAGKSTTVAGVFAELKKSHINCEIAPEFPKELVWEKRYVALKHQPFVLGQHHHQLATLSGQTDVIICDGPILSTLYYNQPEFTDNPVYSLNQVALDLAAQFDNTNYFITRSDDAKYQTHGRNRSREKSIESDTDIIKVLTRFGVDFVNLPVEHAVRCIVESYLKEAVCDSSN